MAQKKKLGVVISPRDKWHFFKDIYEDLNSHYDVDIFQFEYIKPPIFYDRLNRSLYNHKLKSFMRSHEVVFFEWASDWLAYATKFPKECQIVTRLHRFEMYQWAEKINWEVVDRIIVVSQAKRQEFIDRFPEQAEKIVVIPVGVDVNKFQLVKKKFNGDIGILCNLTPRKRVYDLILTFYEITKLHNGLHLHIGGGKDEAFGDYFMAIRNLIGRLNLEDNITLYGRITEPESWYKNIDIFISNSYSEGMQVAPMEAMASGCFCLSHYWEGADELLPEENLFYTGTELQEMILEFCDLSEEKKQIQRELMRNYALTNFDVEKTKVEIRDIIEDTGSAKLF